MASGVRKKIKWHVDQALKHYDEYLQSLKNAWDMGEGESKVLNEYMPHLIQNALLQKDITEKLQEFL